MIKTDSENKYASKLYNVNTCMLITFLVIHVTTINMVKLLQTHTIIHADIILENNNY